MPPLPKKSTQRPKPAPPALDLGGYTATTYLPKGGCVACGGTGKDSRGGSCLPCLRNGRTK